MKDTICIHTMEDSIQYIAIGFESNLVRILMQLAKKSLYCPYV